MTTRAGVLADEHRLLGATMAQSGVTDYLVPERYAGEADASESLDGVALCDLTGMVYDLVSGSSASALAECAFAGRRLAVGECRFEALCAGDGSLVGVPLVMRTGDGEYAVIDASQRAETSEDWLAFLANVEGEGGRAFPDAAVEDATQMMVPLVLWGHRVGEVLGDYLHGAQAKEGLPRTGELRNRSLDDIPCIVCTLPVGGPAPCCLVLVPVPRARALWRSLLSFPVVHPVGHEGLRGALSRTLPWWGLLAGEGPLRERRSTLEGWGLVRKGDGGFVGVRQLIG